MKKKIYFLNNEFKGKLILNLFENDNLDKYLNTLNKCIELLNKSYLGGSGSRGYGKVLATIKEI